MDHIPHSIDISVYFYFYPMARTKQTPPKPARVIYYVTDAGEKVWAGNAPRRQYSGKELLSSSAGYFSSPDDSSDDSGLDIQNLAGAIDPTPPKKKTKVEIAAEAIPSADLEQYDCETDEDTDYPTANNRVLMKCVNN